MSTSPRPASSRTVFDVPPRCTVLPSATCIPPSIRASTPPPPEHTFWTSPRGGCCSQAPPAPPLPSITSCPKVTQGPPILPHCLGRPLKVDVARTGEREREREGDGEREGEREGERKRERGRGGEQVPCQRKAAPRVLHHQRLPDWGFVFRGSGACTRMSTQVMTEHMDKHYHEKKKLRAAPARLGRRVQGKRKEDREIGNLLPNSRRQRRTCYALCHILYPVSAAHTSIFRMDSNSTSYQGEAERGYVCQHRSWQNV